MEAPLNGASCYGSIACTGARAGPGAVASCVDGMGAAKQASMERDRSVSFDVFADDAALLAACRQLRDGMRDSSERLTQWLELQRGWQEHVRRHERYTLPRLARHDPMAAASTRARHLQLGSELERHAIDLKLENVCADVAAMVMLDALITHLTSDAACKFAGPTRRSKPRRERHGP